MKIKLYVSMLASILAMTGCTITPGRIELAAPIVYEQQVVAPPAPVAVVQTGTIFPEAYIQTDIGWIGWYGNTYVYLGPGNVWVFCDEVRLRRFHEWERYHPRYREHATHYHREDNRGHSDRKDGGGRDERKDNHYDKRDHDQH